VKRAAGAGALLLAAAALSAFTITRGYQPHDEGLMLAWAHRIAAGEWPYRDFWINYGPAQPALLAGLEKLFGPSLMWWRVLRVVLDAVVALEAFALVRRSAGLRWALAAWVAVAAAMAWPSGPGPNPAVLALALGGLLLAPGAPLAAGLLAGAAVWFRVDLGLAAVLAVALATRSWRSLLASVVVAAAGLAPFALVAGGAMADQTAGFALHDQGLQRLPFPWRFHGGLDPNKLLEFYLPAILLAGTAAWAAWALWRRRGAAWAPLILVGLAYLLARTDEFHLVPLSVVLAVALALAAAREPRAPVRAALAVLLGLIALHGLERRAGQALHPPALAEIRAAAADGVRTDPADARALAGLLPYVRDYVPPGRPVLVAPPRYDRVRVGDPLLNVLLDRPNPTRYDVIQPGVVTTAAAQREMARDLRRARAVVRWEAPAATQLEANGSARSSGVHILDEAIARGFRPARRFGPYQVLLPHRRR
jgi:hypothetical protein